MEISQYPATATAGSYGARFRTGPSTTSTLKYSFGAGYKFTVVGYVRGELVSGENRWWKVSDGTYVWVGNTIEKPAEISTPSPSYSTPTPSLPTTKIYSCQYCGQIFTTQEALNVHLLTCPKRPVFSTSTTITSSSQPSAPKPEYPKTITAGPYGARFRTAPNTSASIAYSISAGKTFTAVGMVQGESVDGNANWYKTSDGYYVWSGISQEEKPATTPTTTIPPVLPTTQVYPCPYCGQVFTSQEALNNHLLTCPKKPVWPPSSPLTDILSSANQSQPSTSQPSTSQKETTSSVSTSTPEFPKTITAGPYGARFRKAPNTSADIVYSIPAGKTFTAVGIVKGENVDGNDEWYKTLDGYYVWSGIALEEKTSTPTPSPTPVEEYTCPYCGQKFGTKKQLDEHIKSCPKKTKATSWILPALVVGGILLAKNKK